MPLGDPFIKHKEFRLHIDSPLAEETFAKYFYKMLTITYNDLPFIGSPLVVICIGTDRSTGDSLGPLVGEKLKSSCKHAYVFGNLEKPVHAKNLEKVIYEINKLFPNPFIIAIDASLGRLENVGTIKLADGALKPGSGVNKDLPAVGNFHITGIVNVGGYMEFMVLQNTRLFTVMKMVEIISNGVQAGLKKYFEQ